MAFISGTIRFLSRKHFHVRRASHAGSRFAATSNYGPASVAIRFLTRYTIPVSERASECGFSARANPPRVRLRSLENHPKFKSACRFLLALHRSRRRSLAAFRSREESSKLVLRVSPWRSIGFSPCFFSLRSRNNPIRAHLTHGDLPKPMRRALARPTLTKTLRHANAR